MTMLELIQDAFLSALEDGANPPREFTVRLPRGSMLPCEAGHKFSIAGFVVTLELDHD